MKDVLVNTTTGNKWYSLDDVRKSFMLTEGKRKKLIANFHKKEGVAELEDFKEDINSYITGLITSETLEEIKDVLNRYSDLFHHGNVFIVQHFD